MLDSAIDDAVSQALAAVPREHYDGRSETDRVPHSTPTATVDRDLRRAGVSPGMRVLEIGTGTGYTSAVLAALVGEHGQVVSMDIAAPLVARARDLHARRGVTNVILHAADGHLGVPEHGPYDAVLAWASPTEIPDAWVRQCRPGARVCSPVYLAPVAGATGHLCAVVDDDGRLVDPRLAAATSADMGTEAVPDFGAPMHYVDAHDDLAGGGVVWVSTAWRGQYPGHDPIKTLAMLREPEYTEPVELGDTDVDRAIAWRRFRAYCTGRDPSNLTSYGTAGSASVSAIGFSSGMNAAALTSDGYLVANGFDSPALTKVRDYLAEWETSSRPGVETLRPVLRSTGTGWQVRTTPTRLTRRRAAAG
ncbi:MAG TPA: methyltransferase domain-containing protein [Mycobacteriales bacterium]